jgi:hypothetical protein
MKIIKAWRTYNGIYLREEEAMLKKNRESDRDRSGVRQYDEPELVFLLKDDGYWFFLQNVPVVL